MKRGFPIILLMMCAGAVQAFDPSGSPWLAVEDAKCSGLRLHDVSAVIDVEAVIETSGLVIASSELPAYCGVAVRLAPQTMIELRMPIADWTGVVRITRARAGFDDALRNGDAGAYVEPMPSNDAQTSPSVVRMLREIATAFYGRPPV